MAEKNASILVAEDEETLRVMLCELLRGKGYSAVEYIPLKSSGDMLRQTYDVAIVDIQMPGLDGFEICRELHRYSTATQFIFITGFPDPEKLDRAMDMGAYTFLVKPFRPVQLLYAVMGALRVQGLFRRSMEYDVVVGTESMGLIGVSQKMQQVRRRIGELAPLDIPVLITGESGTGKEVVAGCIHRFSQRAQGPFIAVNCASLAPTLIESELFGHAPGAFTGASRIKHGFFEVADNGTLFLDEIGELSPDLQVKFLRVLDKGEFNRVGETQVCRVNVRVVSATNRDLEAMVATGSFRGDLFYRLQGARIVLPPLRERADDILPLLRHFMGQEYALAPEAAEMLQAHAWPGNVRELLMAANTFKGFAANRLVTADIVERVIGAAAGPQKISSYQDAKHETLQRFENEYFSKLLRLAGNMSKAADMAGMHRKNLRDKLKELGIYQQKQDET